MPDRRHLVAVPDLVAETDEDVLDLAPHLRQQVEPAAGKPLAGERDVEPLLREDLLQLGLLELALPGRERVLEPLAQGVERHAALAVADAAQRLLQLALAAEVADANLVELSDRRSGRDRALRLTFEGLGLHAATVSTGRRDPRSPRTSVPGTCLAPGTPAMPLPPCHGERIRLSGRRVTCLSRKCADVSR